ncbi:hypothetical protein ACWGI1_13575 [Streptomyces sp. NPDC054835]
MDLNTVAEVVRHPADRPGSDWHDGDAWLAGGTWLFSTEQPGLRRLVDLTSLPWDPLVPSDAGLEIGATCTVGGSICTSLPAGPMITLTVALEARTGLVGRGIVAATLGFWVIVLYLVTRQFWTLP